MSDVKYQYEDSSILEMEEESIGDIVPEKE